MAYALFNPCDPCCWPPCFTWDAIDSNGIVEKKWVYFFNTIIRPDGEFRIYLNGNNERLLIDKKGPSMQAWFGFLPTQPIYPYFFSFLFQAGFSPSFASYYTPTFSTYADNVLTEMTGVSPRTIIFKRSDCPPHCTGMTLAPQDILHGFIPWLPDDFLENQIGSNLQDRRWHRDGLFNTFAYKVDDKYQGQLKYLYTYGQLRTLNYELSCVPFELPRKNAMGGIYQIRATSPCSTAPDNLVSLTSVVGRQMNTSKVYKTVYQNYSNPLVYGADGSELGWRATLLMDVPNTCSVMGAQTYVDDLTDYYDALYSTHIQLTHDTNCVRNDMCSQLAGPIMPAFRVWLPTLACDRNIDTTPFSFTYYEGSNSVINSNGKQYLPSATLIYYGDCKWSSCDIYSNNSVNFFFNALTTDSAVIPNQPPVRDALFRKTIIDPRATITLQPDVGGWALFVNVPVALATVFPIFAQSVATGINLKFFCPDGEFNKDTLNIFRLQSSNQGTYYANDTPPGSVPTLDSNLEVYVGPGCFGTTSATGCSVMESPGVITATIECNNRPILDGITMPLQFGTRTAWYTGRYDLGTVTGAIMDFFGVSTGVNQTWKYIIFVRYRGGNPPVVMFRLIAYAPTDFPDGYLENDPVGNVDAVYGIGTEAPIPTSSCDPLYALSDTLVLPRGSTSEHIADLEPFYLANIRVHITP